MSNMDHQKIKNCTSEKEDRNSNLIDLYSQLISKNVILQKGVKEVEVVLALPHMTTMDALEEFTYQLCSQIMSIENLRKSWETELQVLKTNFE